MVHERTIADGEYIIGTALTERSSVDIAGGSHEDRANVRLFTTNYSQGQRFNVSYDEQTGYYTIQNVGSDKMIDVQSGIAANGRNVHQWPANGTRCSPPSTSPTRSTSPAAEPPTAPTFRYGPPTACRRRSSRSAE